jgi:hypothetical protein
VTGDFEPVRQNVNFSRGAHAVLLAAISIHGWVAGGDGGRRLPELPLACFSFVMLVVRAGVAPGMTVPARYAYSLDIVA